MTQLTPENYFSIFNKYISGSRISDWLKDKYFFKMKHVTGEIPNKKTNPMLIGSACDRWLTAGKDAFLKEYVVVARRSLKNPPVGIIEITQAQNDEIISICESVERQDAYLDMKNHIAQRILTMPMELGLFEGLCGIPDWFIIDGDTAYITDLKTAEQAKSATKYFYHCLDYGYFRQMGVYDILIRFNFSVVKKVIHRHLVVEKDVDGINKVYTFILDAERVEMEKEFILTDILPAIAEETEFAPSNVKWENATVIGEINQEF